jgi:protein-tyrosine-phosphatase
MLVHFICTGNAYRSRLAEAYFNSKATPGWRATSSGIKAHRNLNGPITWYAARIIQREGLVPFMAPTWQQTSSDVLSAADYIVFMTEEHRAHCHERYELGDKRSADVDDVVMPQDANWGEREAITIGETERTYQRIAKLVDQLSVNLAAEPSSRLPRG